MTSCSKFISFLLIFAIAFSCNDDADTVPIPSTYVVLVAGQSNTHFGIGFDSELDAPRDGIYQLGRFGEDDMSIIPAVEPLQHYTPAENKIGFGLTFAKLIHDYLGTENEIIIIPCGFASTGFQGNHWNKGDDLYEDAVLRVNEVLATHPNSQLISILWHQGENDIGNPAYQESLDQFINDIRQDLNAESVPFILGGMVPYLANLMEIARKQQDIIASVRDRHDLVGYADPERPFDIVKVDNSFDLVHYDAAGQRELAKRYFSEFVRIRLNLD